MRAVLFVAALLGAAIAQADEQLVLTKPGNSAVLSLDGAVAVATFTLDAGTFDLTLRFNEPSGERLQSRIRLVDGQRHAVVLEATRDDAPDLRFSFVRVGMTVEMAGSIVWPLPGRAARF